MQPQAGGPSSPPALRNAMILSFDISMNSTGWVLLQDGTVVEDGTIKTRWTSGGNWWTPHRYLLYFQQIDALFARLESQHTFDLAAEDVAWGGETAPGLFALHPRLWEHAFRLKTRLVYMNWSRWYYWLAGALKASKAEREVEGKALSTKLFTRVNGRSPSCSDVADAWGVAMAAERFLSLVDGRIQETDLSLKERDYFNKTTKRVGPTGSVLLAKKGLLHEKDTNWFDWRNSTDG